MKVLILTLGAYGVNGGIALYNRDLIKALDLLPEVTEITVLQRVIQSDLESPPAKVNLVKNAAGGKFRFTLRTMGQLRPRFDLIICCHINLISIATILRHRSSCPLVLLVYGIDVWERRGQLTIALLERVDRIWSISTITQNRMNSWAKLPDAKYVLLPNAIHLDRYGRHPPPDGLRARLDLIGRRVLLTLTRLPGFDRYKGVDEILECLSELLEMEPNLIYIVAGEGQDRPRLERKAISLGLADKVSFVGYVTEEEKADYYRLADVFALPGRGEGFGFVFLEALACGVPVVGSALDGSREALRDGLLGELVDPRQLSEVRDAVLRALVKPKGIPEELSYFAWPAFARRVGNATRAILLDQAT